MHETMNGMSAYCRLDEKPSPLPKLVRPFSFPLLAVFISWEAETKWRILITDNRPTRSGHFQIDALARLDMDASSK